MRVASRVLKAFFRTGYASGESIRFTTSFGSKALYYYHCKKWFGPGMSSKASFWPQVLHGWTRN